MNNIVNDWMNYVYTLNVIHVIFNQQLHFIHTSWCEMI